MTTDWIDQAERMEAACLKAAADNPNGYLEDIERICWQRWFAWFPVHTFDMYCSADHPKAVRKGNSYVISGKWRWLTYVKRHNLDRDKFKDLEAAE